MSVFNCWERIDSGFAGHGGRPNDVITTSADCVNSGMRFYGVNIDELWELLFP
ncbi:MAG: hypothetical protein ACLUOI_33905 [Eisenbergiella sp.]